MSFEQQQLGWKEAESLTEDQSEHTPEPEQVIGAIGAAIGPEIGEPVLEAHTIKTLQYRLEQADGYYVAKVTGEWDLAAMCQLIDAIGRDSRSHRFERILADCLDVEIAGGVMEYERFVIGRHIGETLRHVRLATLFPAEQINKVAESIALEAGAEFLVTSSRKEALRWLMNGSSSEERD